MTNFLRFCVMLCAILSANTVSIAQNNDASAYFDRNKNISVKERPKPEYQTDGIRSGIWVFKPQLGLATEYTDNVFAEDQDKQNDIIGVIAPSVVVKSDRSIHALEFNAGVETRQFFDNSSESHTNIYTGLRGRLDVRRGAYFDAGVSYARGHDDRTTAGAARVAEERISVDRFDSFIGGYREFGRTRAQAAIKNRMRDYKNGALPDGTALDQDFRDRNDWELEFRGDYAVSPETAVFARAIYTDEDYDDVQGVASRDQKDLTLEVGADFEVTELVRGEVAVGVSDVKFDDTGRDDFNSFSYQAGVEWFATPLITVETNASRRVRPSTLVNASSVLEDQLSLRADYEWRRNIVASAGASFRKSDFRDIARQDKRLSYSVSGTYLMNRNVGLTARLIRTDLDSDGLFEQPDFKETRIMIGVELKR